jgi:putative hemolysin
MQEFRWWIILMLYRSQNVEPGNTEVENETNSDANTWDKAELTGDVVEWTGESLWIANPASEYCVAQWWEVNIVEDTQWNQSGICKLSDWTEVEEWEYFRANNKPEEKSNDVSEENKNSEALTWTEAEKPNEVPSTWDAKTE